MASETITTTEFFLQQLRLSVRYGFIIYPISSGILQKVLKAQKYQVPKPPSPELMAGGILEIEGTIGIKEGLAVDTQIDRQVLAVKGNDIEKIIPAFDELEQSLSTEIGQDMPSKAIFYETVLQFGIRTGKNPLEVLAKLVKDYPYSDRMTQILGQPVAPFSFRFSPANIPIESVDWFDFSIEPMINRATSAYFSNFVFRSANRSKVLDRVRSSKQIVSATLALLESS